MNFIDKKLNDLAIEMAKGSSSSFHKEWVKNSIAPFGMPDQGLFLDFGSGNGELIQVLQSCFARANSNEKYKFIGVDALKKPDHLDCQWISGDLNYIDFEHLTNSIDWVFAVEILEHLENPREIMRKVNQILKLGGKLLLTTPNVESFRSLLSFAVKGHFVDFLDSSYPAHITPLVAMDMIRILKEQNFKIHFLNYSNRGVLPRFTSLTWQELSFGLLTGKRFSDHVMICAEKVI